jgi:anaerobic magnesium-protoporphyrin IX monomethyl ester cyclase
MAKIVFLQQGVFEGLNVMTLAALLTPAGHAVELFIESLEADLEDRVERAAPDLVCFSVISGNHLWAYEKARWIKSRSPKTLTVLGGPHPTFFPESLSTEGVDIICIGEGEAALVELANAYPDIERIKRIPNLHVKAQGQIFRNEVRDLVADLDLLPFPDRDVYYKYPQLRKMGRKTFLTSRGCPYNCSFCFNHQVQQLYRHKGTYLRRRSAENILAEIRAVQSRYGLKSVFFQDDIFILSKSWLADFLVKYRAEIHLPFTCLVRADLVDENVVRQLKKAGCVGVQFGIESGSEEIRNRILRKRLTDAQIVEAARLFKHHRIPFKTYNIIGLPYERVEDVFKTILLNAKIKADLPWVATLTPYPRTDIAASMKAAGLIPGDYSVDDIPSSFFKGGRNRALSDPVVNLHRLFFLAVKFPCLIPLIKKLIRVRPNPVFDIIYYLSQLYIYKRSENLGWIESIRLGLVFTRLHLWKRG